MKITKPLVSAYILASSKYNDAKNALHLAEKYQLPENEIAFLKKVEESAKKEMLRAYSALVEG